MEIIFLKNVIFDAASKAAREAVIKFITVALKLHRCTQIVASGEVTEGNGFSSLGFETMKFEFIYYGLKCRIRLSPGGGQFYAFVEDAHKNMLMADETCMTVDSFIKKLDKKLKRK